MCVCIYTYTYRDTYIYTYISKGCTAGAGGQRAGKVHVARVAAGAEGGAPLQLEACQDE